MRAKDAASNAAVTLLAPTARILGARILGAPAMDAVGTGRAAACRPGGAAPVGVYKPRRAQASPLFRLVNNQFRTLQMVYDGRFAPTYGAWRAVVPEVADKFLACGVLEHGFARMRCDACAPKRLRTWRRYRRALLGDMARVAARTVTAAIRILTREPDLAVGVIAPARRRVRARSCTGPRAQS